MSKVFILGVGAQKSGTTWLHGYLAGHPNADMGFSKEYHIFDALHVMDPGIRKKFLQGRVNLLLQDPSKQRSSERRMAEFLGDTQRYYDYFADLLAGPNVLLTGDITPSYCALPVSVLREIRDEFARRQIDVKVLFLMRDPVERCISAVKHVLRQPGVSYTGQCHYGQDGATVLRDLYRSPAFVMRTRYDETLIRLEQVFKFSDIGVLFYENLFQSAEVERLCEFLSVPNFAANLDNKINESKSEFWVSDFLRKEIYEFYRPVYDEVEKRYGERVMAQWKRY